MHAWESIQATLDFIEDHMTEEIQIQELADIAHLSPFYFQRLFSKLVGKPVMEYRKLRCLANAADYMVNHKDRILDVAMQYGFENHETFTRSFKNAYSITPEEYRNSPRPLSHFLKPELLLKYTLVNENVPLLVNDMILEVKQIEINADRLFGGFSIQNPINDTPGIDFLGELWTKFHTYKKTMNNQLVNGNEAGVSYPGKRPNCFTYFVGAEVMEKEKGTELEHWTMPKGNYVICSFEAENFYKLTAEALLKARDYLLGNWLPKHGLTTDPFMLELYYDTTPESNYMEILFKTKGLNNL